MASAIKSLEREVSDHEQFLDSLVAAARAARDLAQELFEAAKQVHEAKEPKDRKATKQLDQLKGQRDKTTQDYLAAVRNFVALQSRMNHMQADLIKLLSEFHGLAVRIAGLPGKVEEAGRQVLELQAAMQQIGMAGKLSAESDQNGSTEPAS